MKKSGYITLKPFTSSTDKYITCAEVEDSATIIVSILNNEGNGYSLLKESGAAGIE
jgi:hypothetical protein